ncbi:hypothetical protein T440DRAFT_542016 [Plenodomus tracheiphilus IPT5]|uniref:NAD(P)-binding protein n=1 Tax=Plenodomus tracheiphilus IPT5 TaxID=1408161 RepID=A0A6A7BH76_9PLEO|nr:hypothetical protein T440DRAFT_542016 [Plenodomus tracheiphilus IPT5]
MAVTDTHVQPGGRVLVTSVNGSIGSNIASNFLHLGYTMRGTEAFAERHPKSNFEKIVIPDVNCEGAYETALNEVQGIVHVARDMSFGTDPNQIIRQCQEELTSSNRAAFDPILGKEIVIQIRAGLWNQSAIKGAWAPPPYDASCMWDVESQVEQEILSFTKRSQRFVINLVLPGFMVSPIFYPKQTDSTGKWGMDFWRDPGHYEPLHSFIPPWFVDIDDMALLHVAALTQGDAKNMRLWAFADTFNFNNWVGVFRKLEPKKPWPSDDPIQGHDLNKIDTSREVELLERFEKAGWTGLFDKCTHRRCRIVTSTYTKM